MTDGAADPFDLQRFVDAQDRVYEAVVAELSAGRKTSHWIWFVFPQMQGLGHSRNSTYYGLSGADEARAYWAHPVLGPRLAECLELLLATDGRSAHDILGGDDIKLRSCLELFREAVPDEPLLRRAQERFFG